MCIRDRTLTYQDILDDLINGYLEVIKKLRNLGASWIEVDEPALVFDLSDKDIILFKEIYTKILDNKGSVKILLQTYFGDIRDCYQTVLNLDFDGIGLDFIEGKENLTLLDPVSYTHLDVYKRQMFTREGYHYLIISQHPHTFYLKIKAGHRFELKSPQSGKMNGYVEESLNALAVLDVYKRQI